MKILPNKQALQPLASQEKFFLELWHSMTHERSLDSHRVRCLNTRIVLRELDSEIRNGRLSNEEFGELCQEALEILCNDPVMAQSFTQHWKRLEPDLRKPPQIPDEKKKEAKK